MRFLWSSLLATTIASSLAAQDPPPSEERKTFGVGVHLSPVAIFIEDDAGLITPGFGNFLFPIRVSPKLTLEPEFGLLRFSSSSGGGGGVPASSSSFSNSRIGLGILGDIGAGGALSPYVGARIVRVGVTSEFQSSGSSSTTKRSGWTMAAVFGGQHFFTPVFSLGGEIQLARTALGEPEVSGGGGFPGSNEKQTFTGTNALVTVRWFP